MRFIIPQYLAHFLFLQLLGAALYARLPLDIEIMHPEIWGQVQNRFDLEI
jgi:hypothetical protein